jgi:hypothetical protein
VVEYCIERVVSYEKWQIEKGRGNKERIRSKLKESLY